jgi:hypothetical protein
LRQGRLKTLCGKLAVSELPLFAMAEIKGRCKTCFAQVAEDAGMEGPGRAAKQPSPRDKGTTAQRRR